MISKSLIGAGFLLSSLVTSGSALPPKPLSVADSVVLTRTVTTTISSGDGAATSTVTELITAAKMGPSGIEYHDAPTVTEAPSFSTGAMPTQGHNPANMTRNLLGDVASCTFSDSQLIPTDIPTANPYTSSHGVNYFPMGSQNGMILNTAEYISGASTYPLSNSYAVAVAECSDFCDSFASFGHGECLSFNVLTVYEGDFNDCLPTFECRFIDKVYDAADYTLDNGLPSYAWSLKSPAIPTCDLNEDYSPSVWLNAGMDDWLQSYSRSQGYSTLTTGFMSTLMESLGWANYDCDGPMAADGGFCNDYNNNNAQSCANWINRQADMYFTYVDQIYKTFNYWQTFMATQGPAVYENFWNTNPPASAGFDYSSFIETVINSVVGAIPDIGSIAQGILEIGESVWSSMPKSTPVPAPSSSTAWNEHISQVSKSLVTVTSSLVQNATNTGGTDEILDIMRGGAYFLESADGLTIDADAVWTNYYPFYSVQTAVAAMQAQGAFFVRASIAGVPASSCTQKVADEMANYFGKSSGGTAWCDTDGQHVIIPVNGWNMDSYRVMGTVTSTPFDITVQDVYNSASECFAGFGPSNATISAPYGTRQMDNFDFMTKTPDLTAECVWPVPVCDVDTWQATALSQSETSGGYSYSNSCKDYSQSYGDQLMSVSSWYAYQLGFRQTVWWCATAQLFNAFQGCQLYRQCQDYKWPSVVTVD